MRDSFPDDLLYHKSAPKGTHWSNLVENRPFFSKSLSYNDLRCG
jgi:hypothetical protein